MLEPLSLPEGKNWLFVLGVDRGGTTITTRLLNTHPEISVDTERCIVVRCRDLVTQIRTNCLVPPGGGPAYPAIPEDLETIAAIWERQLLSGVYQYYGQRPQRYVGDKIPWYIHHLDYLRETYPGAKYLLNYREPLGTLASWKRMPWRQHLPLPEMVKAYNRIVQAIRVAALASDALVLHHDQLLDDPISEFQRVAEFLALPFHFDVSPIERRAAKQLSDAEREYVLAHADILPGGSASTVARGAAAVGAESAPARETCRLLPALSPPEPWPPAEGLLAGRTAVGFALDAEARARQLPLLRRLQARLPEVAFYCPPSTETGKESSPGPEPTWSEGMDLLLVPGDGGPHLPCILQALENGCAVVARETGTLPPLLRPALTGGEGCQTEAAWIDTVARLCRDLAARADHARRARAMYRRWLRHPDATLPSPRKHSPQPSPGLPPTFPREDRSGTALPAPPIRVGIITPGLLLGGAERWIVNLLETTDAGRLRWEAVALLHPDNQHPLIVNAVRKTCPIVFGEAGVAELVQRCEIVLVWGIPDSRRFFPERRACRAVVVSHGSGVWTAHALADCAYAEGLVAVSHAALDPIPVAERTRVQVLYNGVDPDRVQPRQPRETLRRAWGIAAEQKVLGYLGRLSPEKHPLSLPLALEHLPSEWIGVMVGEGRQQGGVRAYAQAAGGRVRFPGSMEDVGSALHAMDWVLLPSYEEACSLALIEAWLARRPVLATEVGLVREYPQLVRPISPGASGEEVAAALLADVEDPLGTAERVEAAFIFAQRELTLSAFGRAWTDYLVDLAGHVISPKG